MNTKTKAAPKQQRAKAKPAKTVNGIEPPLQHLAVSDIAFSPLNYRTTNSQKALEELVAEMQQHGVISPVTVRPLSTGQYELVAGERRLRAARLAGLRTIPAMVRELTDEQVTEIQLAENIQRENPHPMQEAIGIGRLQQSGKSMQEISQRIGKSTSFVYSRLLLLSLIPEFQEMLAADRVTLSDALAIASLAAASQTAFYTEQHCEGWKDKPDFRLRNVHHSLAYFSNDLKKAPFDPKDKTLLPEAGACTKCPSNTATLKSLFPEMAKEAICKNLSCYQHKCTAHFSLRLAAALLEHEPQAILTRSNTPAAIVAAIAANATAAGLPQRDYYSTYTINPPEAPDPEDYFTDDEEEPQLDETAYQEACAEYEEEMADYRSSIQSGTYSKGILITSTAIEIVYFNSDPQHPYNSATKGVKPATAKEVAEAIKQGSATPELLQGEIDRIQQREKRSKEIDRQKVVDEVHAALETQLENQRAQALTPADEVAARLLIFQLLGYSGEGMFFSRIMDDEEERPEGTAQYHWLANLSPENYSQLIRTALARKPESKLAHNITGHALYQVAEQAGVAVTDIEQQQAEKAKKREERQEEKIAALQAKLTKLTATA